jgi:glycosyltransferase involved in cell wall biosynthesis
MLACRLLDLSEVAGTPVDLLIGLKFPAYLIPHSNKVVWVLHQFRTAYELWDHPLGDLVYAPNGNVVRDAIREADQKLIPEARKVFANSANVAKRLKDFCDIDSQPLYHPPPNAEKFFCQTAQDYFFYPSRLCHPKRQALVIESLMRTKEKIRVRFAGNADNPHFANELRALAKKLRVSDRVEWLGQISEEQKRELYAAARAVLFPPIDEDYGYVTLEAMLSAKPVITCRDSGGPLEFVQHEKTGLIADPNPDCFAGAMDRMWRNADEAQAFGEAGRKRYEQLNINWKNVVRELTN